MFLIYVVLLDLFLENETVIVFFGLCHFLKYFVLIFVFFLIHLLFVFFLLSKHLFAFFFSFFLNHFFCSFLFEYFHVFVNVTERILEHLFELLSLFYFVFLLLVTQVSFVYDVVQLLLFCKQSWSVFYGKNFLYN